MAVKILMTLDGVDQVTAGFAEAQKAGEDMMKSITGLSDQDPLKGFSLSIGGATQAMGEHARSVSGVTEAYHILAPLLREVGLSIGELRGLSILARDTFLGLAAVVGGGIAIALAKLEEQAAQLKGTLTDLAGGSTRAGQQAFDSLSKSALTLGTSVGALAPGLEAAIIAFQKFQATTAGGVKFVAFNTADLPASLNAIKTATDAYTNFILLLRAGRLDETNAEAAASKFFTSLGAGGKLTSQILSALPVGTVDELAKALGRGGESTQTFIAEVDKLNISTAKAEQAVAAYKTQSQNAFDAKAIITFNDELKKTAQIFLTEFQKAFGEPFSEFVLQELHRIQQGIKSTSTDIENLIAIWNKLKETTTPAVVASEFDVFGTGSIADANKISQPLLDSFLKIQTGFHAIAADATSSLSPIPTMFGSIANAAATATSGVDAFGNSLANAVLKQGDVTKITKAFQGFVPTSGFATLPGAGGEDPFSAEVLDAKAAADQIAPAMKSGIDAAKEALGTIFDGLADGAEAAGKQAGEDVGAGIDTALQQTGQQLAIDAQAIWNNLKSILSQPINIPTTVSPPTGTGLARGGLVSGPGTGTSDSIMAMLSNREFVVNARSTEFYGPGFFAALNAMLVPRDLLPGFAMGGLVKAIASTPGQSARTPIVLNIDRHTFNMTATDDVAAALQTLSVSEQMSAAGRSPGWRRS